MEEVFELIQASDLHAALIRIWVLSTSSIEHNNTFIQQASLWQQQPPVEPLNIDLATWLENPSPASWPSIENYPLELFRALDQHLCQLRDSHSLAKYEVNGKEYALLRRRFPHCRARQQAPNPGHWSPGHNVIPLHFSVGSSELLVKLGKPQPFATTEFGEVRCRLTHFDDQVALLIEEFKEDGKFIARQITPEDKRAQQFSAELNLCAKDHVHFWVAPELSNQVKSI